MALFLGVEGSYAIDDDVEAGVARLAEAGVMFLGPLWERDSGAGSSCRTADARDRGLTDEGRILVRACDAAGIRLDASTPVGRPSGKLSSGRSGHRSRRIRARPASTRIRAPG